MSKLKEAAISVAAGAASIPLFLSMGIHANITDASIEACAKALEHPGSNPTPDELPADCNSTSQVFPTTEVTFNVVSSPGEDPYPVTSQRYVLLSPKAYKEEAEKFKAREESKARIEVFAAFAGGIMVAGGTFYAFNIRARCREAEQVEQAEQDQANLGQTVEVPLDEQGYMLAEQQVVDPVNIQQYS